MEKIVDPCEGCCVIKRPSKTCRICGASMTYQARLDQQRKDWKEFVEWLKGIQYKPNCYVRKDDLLEQLQQQLGGQDGTE